MDWKVITEYFGLDDTKFLQSQVLGSGQSEHELMQNTRKFRFVSAQVSQLLKADTNKSLKILNLGCKLFERGKESFGGQVSPFRISQEGIYYVLPFLTKRKLEVSKDLVLHVVKQRNFRLNELPDERVQEQIQNLGSGCFVFYFQDCGMIEGVVCQFFKQGLSLMCSTEQVENIMIRYQLM